MSTVPPVALSANAWVSTRPLGWQDRPISEAKRSAYAAQGVAVSLLYIRSRLPEGRLLPALMDERAKNPAPRSSIHYEIGMLRYTVRQAIRFASASSAPNGGFSPFSSNSARRSIGKNGPLSMVWRVVPSFVFTTHAS